MMNKVGLSELQKGPWDYVLNNVMHLEGEYYIIPACCVGKMLGTFSL